jgi:hypothetical protein
MQTASDGRGGLALAIGALICLCLSACGSADHGVSSAPRPASGLATQTGAAAKSAKSYRTGDNDVDDENGEDRPDDDYPLTKYGHAASAAEKRAITALLEHYYAAATAEDGAKACSLLYSSLARDPDLTKTVPADRFSYPIRVRISPGESCAHVLSALFKHRHPNLMLDAPTLQVTTVRVDGAHGMAVLGFRTAPEHWMPIARERGVWKAHALLGLLLP